MPGSTDYASPATSARSHAAVYTSRFTGGRNGFEFVLAYLGIRQKNGALGRPQRAAGRITPAEALGASFGTGQEHRIVLLDGSHLVRVLTGAVALPDLLRLPSTHLEQFGEPLLRVSRLAELDEVHPALKVSCASGPRILGARWFM